MFNLAPKPHSELVYSCILLNSLGWHWLVRLYRFWVYISKIYHLCIASCAHEPKSNHLLSWYAGPLSLYYPYPLPSGNHHMSFVSVSCLFAFLFSSYIAFSFLSYVWVTPYGSCSVWPISHSMVFSRSIPVVLNGSISLFLIIARCIYVPILLYPVIHWRTLGLFPCLSHCK